MASGRSTISTRPFLAGIVLSSGESQRIIAAAGEYSRRTGNTVLGSLEKPYNVDLLIEILQKVDPEALAARRRKEPPVRVVNHDPQHLRVVFQGKYDLSGDRVPALVAFEALSRTADGSSAESLFAPNVPPEEQERLTMVVLDRCRDFAADLDRMGERRKIAVNLTPTLFSDSDFILRFADRVEALGLPRGTITVELTEQYARADTIVFAAIASQLEMRGIEVALDDFGTGNCSLEWMVDVPATELKIDKSIFWHFASGRMPRLLLESIIAHCRSAGSRVTIEGIESEQHLALARDVGAHLAQGYFFGPPAAPGTWIDRFRNARAPE